MSVPQEALRALGLTDYAARAYVALAALGASPAEKIASAAPIPRTKIYAVLTDLVKRGWADVEAGRPKRYRARRPSECFERERARIDAVLDAGLPILEEQFRDRSRRFAGPLWLLSGADLAAERTLEMVNAAKREVLLVASFPLPGDERALAQAMRKAQRRGVRVRVAAPDLAAPHVRAFEKAGAELRLSPKLPPRLLGIDGQQALMAFPKRRADGSIEVNAVWNPSPELMDLIGGALGAVWDDSATPGARSPRAA